MASIARVRDAVPDMPVARRGLLLTTRLVVWFHLGVGRRRQPTTRRRGQLALLLNVSLLVVILGIASLARDSAPEPPGVAPVTTTTAPTTTVPAFEVPPSTPLASPNGKVTTYDDPDGTEVGSVGFWYGYPMTMPIVEERGGWLRIMLPERPNGSTAWVRSHDVTRSSTAFRVVVRLAETRLTVYQDGFELFSAPVGIGKAATPTAPGHFFVAVVEKPGPRGYGPVVLDTSGHSEAIKSWEGSGDAITAIHGPISPGSDAQIGTTGTRISNGCVRMHLADQEKLAVIPLGTPVDIIG